MDKNAKKIVIVVVLLVIAAALIAWNMGLFTGGAGRSVDAPPEPVEGVGAGQQPGGGAGH